LRERGDQLFADFHSHWGVVEPNSSDRREISVLLLYLKTLIIKKADGEWRLKTSEELENAIRYENIVRHIKSRSLSWLGHVERMPNERVVKTIYKRKPYATRPK
jgi:hypothetical protein